MGHSSHFAGAGGGVPEGDLLLGEVAVRDDRRHDHRHVLLPRHLQEALPTERSSTSLPLPKGMTRVPPDIYALILIQFLSKKLQGTI